MRPAVTFGLPASSKGAAVRSAASFGLSASSDRRLQVGWPLCMVGLGIVLAAGSELKCPQGSVGIGARRRSGQAFGLRAGFASSGSFKSDAIRCFLLVL